MVALAEGLCFPVCGRRHPTGPQDLSGELKVRRETQPGCSLGKLAFRVRPRLPVTRPLAKQALEWLLT